MCSREVDGEIRSVRARENTRVVAINLEGYCNICVRCIIYERASQMNMILCLVIIMLSYVIRIFYFLLLEPNHDGYIQ